MSEELNLVRDLAIILISAGVFTIICKALKQPSILGYIIAGFLISPNLGIFGISSMETVETWSEIGVIFLMFGLGLEFSFKKLIAVGASALTIAGSKFLGTFVIGFTVGRAIGWTSMESIFLAGLLSMSSTAVIIKSYDELGLKQKPFAGMVFGSLVVEDLLAILMMVLLPTIAVAGKFEGGAMVFNLAKLAFFLILWFLVGIYVIPTLLKRFKAYINDEILLIVSIGLCFAMVTLANAAGLSSALGAFVIGSILSETIESERIEHLISPIKELFGAIFFVSVGMMISPSVIAEHWAVILILTLVVLISDSIFAATGVLLSGGGLKNALPAGLSLAQLGEFGFILVTVGISLGVMREFIYPVIVAVSVITIFLSPYMIKLADPIYSLLKKKLPQNVLDKIDSPTVGTRSTAEKGEWKKLLQAYAIRIVLYGVILIAIILLANVYLDPFLTKLFPTWSEPLHNWVMVVASLVIMAPFLFGLSISSGSINQSATKLIQEKQGNIWPIFGLTLLRIFIALGFVLSVISNHISLSGWAILAILAAGLILLLFGRRYLRRYNAIEKQFLENLNDKETRERARKPISTSIKSQLGAYNVHIEQLQISPDSSYIGHKLREIPIRAESGANIIKVTRGSKGYTIPSADFVIYPSDRILAVGTTEQLEKFRALMDASIKVETSSEAEFKVEAIEVDAESYLCGKALKGLNLRDYKCMIVSVLRDGEFITNPKADLVFKEGDVVWVAGDTSACDWLK